MNKRYIVSGGAALAVCVAYLFFVHCNVAKLHALTVSDPLFYDATVDQRDLQHAVKSLTDTEAGLFTILKTLPHTTNAKPAVADTQRDTVLADHLYPLNYLDKLPASVSATDQFLTDPTFAHTWSMLRANTAAADAYYQDAQSLHRRLQETIALAGYDVDTLYTRMFSSITSTDQQLADIALIVKNGAQLQKTVRARYWCLFTGLSCSPASASDQEVTQRQSEYIPDINTFSLLSTTTAFYTYQPDIVHGPFLIESGCFPQRFTPMYSAVDNRARFLTKGALENYYLETTSRKPGQYLSSHPEPYYFQIETTNYRCLDLSYWADVATLMYLQQNTAVEHAPTSTTGLRLLEQNAYQLSQSDRHAMENKLWQLPAMLRAADGYLKTHISILEEYADRIPIEYSQLLAIRSSYGLTYQPFAKSIWRIPEKPAYYVRANMPVGDGHTPYSVLTEHFSPDEILQRFHPVIAE